MESSQGLLGREIFGVQHATQLLRSWPAEGRHVRKNPDEGDFGMGIGKGAISSKCITHFPSVAFQKIIIFTYFRGIETVEPTSF